MNKSELVEFVANKAGLTKADAERAVNAVVEGVTGALKKGLQVVLVGFGTFKVSARKARTGRNPQTGATINIPARTVPVFKAGKKLKDEVK